MRLFAFLAVSFALLSTACGPMLWGLTPKQEPTYHETLRMDVHVVHGAPGGHLVRVPSREIRAERRKERWPTALGMVVDIIGGLMLTAITQDVTDEPPATVTVGAAMLSVVVLDVYLMASRSVESEPVAFEEWHQPYGLYGPSGHSVCPLYGPSGNSVCPPHGPSLRPPGMVETPPP